MELIERRARAALDGLPAYIWDGASLPVPIEDIADSWFGLLVRDIEDMSQAPGCPPLSPGQTISGLLFAERREIWVNAHEGREWPGRRRFTVAHELGHWCMHRFGGQPLFCRHGHVDFQSEDLDVAPEPDRLEVYEEEANVFAAALLMPAELMRREYEQNREFGSLCERFGSSGAAMSRRLRAVI